MNIKNIISISTAVFFLVSCSNDNYSPDVLPDDDEKILIGAGTSDLLYSRGSYQTDDEDNVSDGLFYLTYPISGSTASNPQYNRLYVDFSKAQYYPKYGRRYAYTEAIEAGSELTNAMIGTSPNLMFLDNVDPTGTKIANDTLVVFPQTGNPYSAGLMTSDKDILWGSIQRHNSNLYDFDLHHVMAGVRVKITIDLSEDNNLIEDYDLTNAEVYLTNIILDPYSYSRTTGSVNLAQNPVYSPTFMLVNNLEETDDEEIIDWSEITFEDPDNVENPGNPIYITQDFILAPQSPNDENWPELVIRFPNPSEEEVAAGKAYKEFYGKLPRGMFTAYPSGTNYGLDLAFLREHILEIRTQISQNPPLLVFMPVRVYNWVNWGPYTVIGHQEGVYSATQLNNIISYYVADNAKMLQRFGEVKTVNGTQKWVFNVFSNITVSLEQVNGTMQKTTQTYGVSFMLNNYKIRVTLPNGSIYTITDSNEFTELITNGTIPKGLQDLM